MKRDYEGFEKAILKRDGEYSEGKVSGEQLAFEVEINSSKNSPIYFVPHGFMCVCGDFMGQENSYRRVEKTFRVFCSNPNCSHYMITKIVKLPFITDYVISPSDV